MVMKALRDGAKGGVTKFILFGFMALATGGLVMMDVGGVFRGGVGSTDVAKAGEQTISINSFDNTVRRTAQQLGMSPQEAYRVGYVNQMLAGEIRGRLLNQAAAEHGIRISDKIVAEHINTLLAPYTANGEDPKNVLQQLLYNQGMNQAGFVASIRREMSNQLLTNALQKNLAHIGDDVANDLYRFQNEKRDIEYIAFMNDDLKEIPAPTDEQLQELYEATKESFAEEETRRLKIITIKTAALKNTIDISDEEVRQTYDDNIDLYTSKAYWTLEQAILDNEEQAKSAIAAAQKGQDLKAAVEAAAGNSVGYLGEQDVTEENIIEDVKEAVLAAEKSGDVIGPVQSPLGWYVVKIKKISPEHVKPFADAKTEIVEELKNARLIDEQYAMANMVDDLMASGMPLEEVAQEVDLEIQTLTPINSYGQGPDGKDALNSYGENNATILQSAFELYEGETSPVFETSDGKFMAVHVESVKPRSYKDFDAVKDQLEKRWVADQRRVGTRIIATQFLTEINADGKSLAETAKAQGKTLYTRTGIGRNDDPDGALNTRSVMNVFEAPLKQPVMLDIDGGIAIARVTGFSWPKDAETEMAELKKSLAETAQNEGLALYLNAKRDEYGAKVNERLLDQVYGGDPQGN